MSQAKESDEALAKRLIGLAMTVQRTLGCGFLESIYVNALVLELQEAGISFEREKRYSVVYKNTEIGSFHADLVIENRLIVEVKAVEALAIAHSIQVVKSCQLSCRLENRSWIAAKLWPKESRVQDEDANVLENARTT